MPCLTPGNVNSLLMFLLACHTHLQNVAHSCWIRFVFEELRQKVFDWAVFQESLANLKDWDDT